MQILPLNNGNQTMHSFFRHCLLVLLFISLHTAAQQPLPSYKLISSTVASKNYYLLGLLENDKAAKTFLAHDSVLNTICTRKLQQMTDPALQDCNNNLSCFIQMLSFSEEEIAAIGQRLAALYSPGNALGNIITKHIIPSGTYALFQNLNGAELLVKAWEQDAKGINFAIAVYGGGKKPNYPNIDSIAFNVQDNGYSRLLYSVVYLVKQECKKTSLFFIPSLTAALRLLEINEREQAGDYEPMTSGENKAAIDRVSGIQWNNYTYSVIVVPGAGPELPSVALSAEGMLRCRLAAQYYFEGIAPFIMPSGGKVHPYKTKYCEAIEMKRYLTEKLHVPANAVIIEPHARHTTTNMRNAARLIFRYGLPFNKAAVSCTTRGQSNMIEKTLIERCRKELNETPYKNGNRISETLVEFYPLVEALHINPMEPMDP